MAIFIARAMLFADTAALVSSTSGPGCATGRKCGILVDRVHVFCTTTPAPLDEVGSGSDHITHDLR